jgi:hypothetical protein
VARDGKTVRRDPRKAGDPHGASRTERKAAIRRRALGAKPIVQLRKRLSVGTEGLYGMKETRDGSGGEVFRFQLGLLYSTVD